MTDFTRIKNETKNQIARASERPVGDYFASCASPLRQLAWIDPLNRYRESCIEKYHADRLANPFAVADKDIRNYVAASGPAHIFDGWSFLGRAVSAALSADAYSAIHLAYYAELRAAMALLAVNGIGIFSTGHCLLLKTKTLHTGNINRGRVHGSNTHQFVWPCLEYWSTKPVARQFVEEIFQPAGYTLGQWLDSCGAKLPVGAAIAKMMQKWGIDLSELSEDRNIRNLASYRPSDFQRPAVLSTTEAVKFVVDLWRCFEPQISGRFPILERTFLKSALESGGVKTVERKQIENLGLADHDVDLWKSALDDNAVYKPLEYARQVSPVDSAECSIQIISRAALLLSLATAGARRHLSKAGYSVEDLKFFWEFHGLNRGFWATEETPDSLLDLWQDVEAGLDDLKKWQDDHRGGNPTFYDLRLRCGHQFGILGAFELIAFWGLVP